MSVSSAVSFVQRALHVRPKTIPRAALIAVGLLEILSLSTRTEAAQSSDSGPKTGSAHETEIYAR